MKKTGNTNSPAEAIDEHLARKARFQQRQDDATRFIAENGDRIRREVLEDEGAFEELINEHEGPSRSQ